MTIFNEMESVVQSYARSFPVVFNKAIGTSLHDEQGKVYLDFLAGAGALNYGHNHPALKQALLDYISNDGVTHSLDMHSEAKARFLTAFRDIILAPRQMDYRVQFTGPTGTNAVEAALKLARKVTGRRGIISFTNGFHGVTLGAVSATGNQHHRGGAGVSLNDVQRMPFCGYYGQDVDTLAMIEKLLTDPSSGIELPAAMILETVQGEGGLNVASDAWLQGIERLCRQHDILLIVDDIQAGCGRTGTFFSFEPSGIKPDIITQSKSLSAYGSPFAVVLIRPDLDIWAPGEHNGTFRGNNHAFVTATAALETFWQDDSFAASVRSKAARVTDWINATVARHQEAGLFGKGRGLMQGIDCGTGDKASAVSKAAFEGGVIIETAGNLDQVVKLFCPLTISEEELEQGLKVLSNAFDTVFGDQDKLRAAS